MQTTTMCFGRLSHFFRKIKTIYVLLNSILRVYAYCEAYGGGYATCNLHYKFEYELNCYKIHPHALPFVHVTSEFVNLDIYLLE